MGLTTWPRDIGSQRRNVGMFVKWSYSWVFKQRGLTDSALCLPSCLPFSTVLFPSLLLSYFVREIKMYNASILAVIVRVDIHMHKYMHTFSVLRENIMFVITYPCLSHNMITDSSPVWDCLPLPHSLTSLNIPFYPNIGTLLTAPSRTEPAMISVYFDKVVQ